MGIISNTYHTLRNASERARIESDSNTRRVSAQTEMDEDVYFRQYEVEYQEKINNIESRRTEAQITTQNIKRDRMEALIQNDEADTALQQRLLKSRKNKVAMLLENKELYEELKLVEMEAGLEPTDFTKLLG